MIYNHIRQPVWAWAAGQPSFCPECGATLIAKRGDVVVWHWAHKAKRTSGCPNEESLWHLRFKEVYLQFPKWDIEVPLVIDSKRFRVDAIRKDHRVIREFVHSLSPHYQRKHEALVRGRFNVLWVIDGKKFASARRKEVSGGGLKRLLKPIARDLCEAVNFRVLVHFEDQFWAHWDHDVWYPKTGKAAGHVLELYAMRAALDEFK